ncbi:hypothetical protein BC826DRAFT_82073 [Russula brevipes]|nr:hypothetical protein BC826DRAFT_82073 [Russula brevipes]
MATEKLAHLPSIPLVINYRNAPHVPYIPLPRIQRDAEDRDSGILHALQQYDRTRYIILEVPSEALHNLIVPLDRSFPKLETLSLLSQAISNKDTMLMLPSGFLAPNLRHLELRRISLPKGLPFLASTPFLVILRLTNIQNLVILLQRIWLRSFGTSSNSRTFPSNSQFPCRTLTMRRNYCASR